MHCMYVRTYVMYVFMYVCMYVLCIVRIVCVSMHECTSVFTYLYNTDHDGG